MDEDDDNDDSNPLRPASNRLLIGALEVGESFVRAQRIEFEHMNRQALIASSTLLRNATVSAVTRARNDTGSTYTIESTQIFTRAKDLLLLVIVTRTK